MFSGGRLSTSLFCCGKHDRGLRWRSFYIPTKTVRSLSNARRCQGRTEAEAMANIREAIEGRLWAENLKNTEAAAGL
jgi:hypothetical protein